MTELGWRDFLGGGVNGEEGKGREETSLWGQEQKRGRERSRQTDGKWTGPSEKGTVNVYRWCS